MVLPRFSFSFKNRDFDAINKLLRKVAEFTICLGFPCVVGMFFLAEDILLLIAGDEYIMAANCLRILSVSMLFMYLINLFGNLILLPQGRDKIFTFSWVVAMAFNIVSNAFVIPIFGIEGAATTTLLANMIVAIFSIVNSDKNIKLDNKKSLLFPPLIGSVLVALICIATSEVFDNAWFTVITSVLISLIVYFIVLVIFKYQIVISALKTVMTFVRNKELKKKGK